MLAAAIVLEGNAHYDRSIVSIDEKGLETLLVYVMEHQSECN